MMGVVTEALETQGPIGFSTEGLAEFFECPVSHVEKMLQYDWRTITSYVDPTGEIRWIHPKWKEE